MGLFARNPRQTVLSRTCSGTFAPIPANRVANVRRIANCYRAAPGRERRGSSASAPASSRGLLPIRSNHLLAAVEQRLGPRTRIRAEYYNRADRDLSFQPLYDPGFLNGKLVVPSASPRYLNSLRGYSRGFEVFVQRSHEVYLRQFQRV